MTDTRAVFRRGKRFVGNHTPERVSDLLARGYNRYRERQADATFRSNEANTYDPDPTAPQHVVLIVVDALRHDALGQDGTECLTGLDSTDAIATAPWTYPSVTSLLTGLYPHESGVIRQSDEPDNVTDDEISVPPKLGDGVETLPGVLSGAGYDTYGAFAFDMPFLALSGRFDTHRLYRDPPAAKIFEDYREWLAARSEEQTFAYLHTSDLHAPVDPPAEYWKSFEVDKEIPNITNWEYLEDWSGGDAERYRSNRRRLYDAALSYVDDQIQTLRTAFDRLDCDPVFLVTGDHGEGFWEHADFDAEHFYDSRPAYCVGHGGTPYEALTRVPICIDGIDRSDGPRSLIDVYPTVVRSAGIETDYSGQGVPLQSTPSADRILLTESARYGYEKKAVYRSGWKRLVSRGDETQIGFALPEEEPADLPRRVEASLSDALPAWPDAGEDRTVDGTVRDRLEHLGYK